MSISILAVDDKKDNLNSLKSFLQENLDNINIVLAQDGNSALEIAHNEDIDLIILDIQMPIIDGFEIAKYLKINPKTKDIPIIFLTAVFIEDEFKEKGFDLGGIDYLVKPVETIKLINQIKLYKKIILNEKKLKGINTELEKKIKEESEKRITHERIVMCQSKMATMGEMMSNIAHQWRQPLASIVNNVDYIKILAETHALSEDELIHNLDNVAQTALFLSETINTFRNFFKGDKLSVDFKLKEIVDDVLRIVHKTLEMKNIKIIVDVGDCMAYGLKNELEQAVLNIINNAKDVLVEKNGDKEKLIFVKTYSKDGSINISIKDNGGGIEPKIMEKIFEPYFTTKHQSQGTGIGLYMTYQIVVEHFKGEIVVENSEYDYEGKTYKGANFIISFANNIKVCNNINSCKGCTESCSLQHSKAQVCR